MARSLQSRVLSYTGYYMRDGACYSTLTNKAVSTSECDLGAYLRIVEMVSPDTPDGGGCPTGANEADGRRKCLDRFYYDPEGPVVAWQNLNPVGAPCINATCPPPAIRRVTSSSPSSTPGAST